MAPVVHKPWMREVKSSNVAKVGHHLDRSELHVTFNNGGHYIYHDVGPEHLDAIVAHPSPGAYIAKNIKNKFKHTKVE